MNKLDTIYYKSRIATVRIADIKDVFLLAPKVKESDKIEVWRSHHRSPEAALMEGFTNSSLCFTVECNESPIAMFGINPQSILGNNATIWLLSSDELEKIQKAFLRHSRRFINLMLSEYALLNNFVDVENRQTIKWLKWCGANLGPVVPYGAEKAPFQYFEFRR